LYQVTAGRQSEKRTGRHAWAIADRLEVSRPPWTANPRTPWPALWLAAARTPAILARGDLADQPAPYPLVGCGW